MVPVSVSVLIMICQSSVCLFLWVPSYSWVCLHWPCGLFHFDHFNNQYSQSTLCYIFHESESALGSTFLTTWQPLHSKGIFIFNWKLWQYKYISNSTSYRNNLNLGSTPQKPLFTGRILSDLMQNTQKHKSEVYVCMCATQPSYLGAETKTLNQKIWFSELVMHFWWLATYWCCWSNTVGKVGCPATHRHFNCSWDVRRHIFSNYIWF